MALPTITFPDVVMLACTRVRAGLSLSWLEVTVGRTVPNPRPALMVQVVRDGGPQSGPAAEEARLRVNVWAPLPETVEALALAVSAVLRAWPDGTPVCRVTQNSGPSPVPDATGERRLMYFDVLVRGAQS